MGIDNKNVDTDQKITLHPTKPETITGPGTGIERRSLLVGAEVRTRITTQSKDGETWNFIIVGGNNLADGRKRGERPPLVINEALYINSKGQDGIAVLPYSAKTLRAEDGVFVGETFTLGAPENPADLGEVTQIDHVPSYPSELTSAELNIKQLFQPWEATISHITQTYNNAPSEVIPPNILP